MKIASKLGIWFLLIGILPGILVAYYGFRQVERGVLNAELGKLESIVDDRADDIGFFIQDKLKDIRVLANAPSVVARYKAIHRVYLERDQNKDAYEELLKPHELLHEFELHELGYYDAFLIDLTGNVFFTDKLEPDLGTNLEDSEYRDNHLASTFRAARDRGETRFSDFSFYSPTGKPAAFLATPLWEQGRMIGILALQHDSESIYALARDFSGLGRSGEVIIARDQPGGATLVAPTRKNEDSAFTPLPLELPSSAPMRQALAGQKGRGIATSPDGKAVLAAWTLEPLTGWGVVARIDKDEALETVHELRRGILLASCVALLVLILTARAGATRFAQRIGSLREATRQMAAGELSSRAQIEGDDEFDDLSADFNSMAESLQSREGELEARNRELLQRTRELKVSQQELLEHGDQLEAVNRKLELAVREAIAASRAKSEFLANMSHEIRTPINAITGFSYCLANSDLDEQQRDWLQKSQESTRHLMQVVSDILDFSKIEADKLELERRDFDPREMLREIRSMFERIAREKRIDFQLETEALPDRLRGDVTRLRQALLNLVSNGVKFTAVGSVRVRASLLEQDGARSKWRFEVADTGTGIEPAHRNKLMEAFGQADASTTRRFGGTGLGLNITKRLAELMGGGLDFESDLGQGSTFWIDVWLDKARGKPETRQPDLTVEEAKALLASYSPARVLLVEDNLINREIAARILGNAGLDVAVAESGEEAVSKAGEERFDIILMDIQMPGMDGWEATRAIRAAQPAGADRSRVPIIAMTANVFTEHRDACFEAGMDDFIAKPVEPAEMYKTIARWLTRQGGAA